MAPSPKSPAAGGLAGLMHNRKAIAGVVALLLVAYLYLRSRSSSSTTSAGVDPNAVDPATGLTYAEEQQAALNAQAGGSTSSTDGATTDSITTPSGESLSSALTDFGSSLSALQTQQSNDEALLQSASQAAAQANEQLASLTSLGAPGPQGAGVGAGSPAVGSVSGGTVTVENDTISGGTVYQAPVTNTTVNETAPAPPKAPAAAPAKATSSPPKATTPTKSPTVNAYNSPATSTHLH